MTVDRDLPIEGFSSREKVTAAEPTIATTYRNETLNLQNLVAIR